jgi:hypothetical protein
MAAELGNVRAARRAIGIHPSIYYCWSGSWTGMAQRSCAPREAPGAAFADSKRQPPEALRRDLAARGWSGASSDPVVGPDTSHH